MGYFDDNEEILFLLKDFSNKLKDREPFIFYDAEEWLDIIDYFFLEGDYDELLVKAVQLALLQYPKNEDLIVRKAELISREDYKEALLYLLNEKKEINDKKKLTLLAYQGAQILSKAGNHKNALKTALDCLKHEENEYLLNLIAQQYIKLKEYEEAKNYLLKAFDYCYEKYTKHRDEEIRSYGATDYMYSSTVIPDDLISVTAELCTESPNYKELFFPYMEKFVEFDPQNTCYWEMLAEFYERCYEPQKALNACDYFLCLEPNDLDVIRRKYINYVNCGYKKDRIKILKKISVLLVKELEPIKVDIKYKHELLSSLTATYKELTNVYIEEEKYEDCIEVCKEILEKSTSFPILTNSFLFTKANVFFLLSRSYYKVGDFSAAKQYALKSIKEEPDNISHKINLAELLYLIGEINKGNDLYQELFEFIKEMIAEEKSRDEQDGYSIDLLFDYMTALIISWAKQLSLIERVDEAFNLLKSYTAELFLEENKEENVVAIILTCAEIIFNTKTSNHPLIEIIQEALIVYGDSIIESLSESSLIISNENLISDLQQIIENLKNNEELL